MTKMVHLATAIALAVFAGGFEAQAETAAPTMAKNVVLVHGAWADGSSWAGVIPYLQAAGLKVTAVQNPLTSLDDSVAATRRALALQDGPTVLVAHSWGGWSMSPRAPPTPAKISSHCPENIRPERSGPVSRCTMASPDWPRSRS